MARIFAIIPPALPPRTRSASRWRYFVARCRRLCCGLVRKRRRPDLDGPSHMPALSTRNTILPMPHAFPIHNATALFGPRPSTRFWRRKSFLCPERAILAEVAGYAATADAHHVTEPAHEWRRGAPARAMRVLWKGRCNCPEDVSYINAHGTHYAGDRGRNSPP